MNLHQFHLYTYLRKSRSDNKEAAKIYIRVRYDNQKMELSTGHSIEPKGWDVKRQRICVKHPLADIINPSIESEIHRIRQNIVQLQLSKEPVTLDNLKRLLVGETLRKKVPTLLEVIAEHNEQFRRQIGTRYSFGSLKNYLTTERFMKEFLPEIYGKKDLQLDQVNLKFCERWYIWLTTQKTCANNGAAKHIQRIKKIVQYAVLHQYLSANPILGYRCTLKSIPRTPLTWEEIERIMGLSLQTERLEQTRLIFVFQIFTGLAYADVKAFSQRHITIGTNGTIWIRMERTKTRNTFMVPLLPPAMRILQLFLDQRKVDDQPIFPVLSNQKMNQQLKIIQELAAISKNLHSHLPRHTFATTIALASGMSMEALSKVLGHTKIATTQVYGKLQEARIGEEMRAIQVRLQQEGRLN